MTRSNQIFDSALEVEARFITKDHNIRIVRRGNLCATDGKVIWLPLVDDTQDELATDLRGMLHHETGHCLYTDFIASRELYKPMLHNRFLKEFVNAVEDSRMEALLPVGGIGADGTWKRPYPGMRVSLLRLNQKWKYRSSLTRFAKHMVEVIDPLTGITTEVEKWVTPWPSRWIRAAREVYDDKKPQLDEQTEPLLLPLIPDLIALRDLTNTRDLILACEAIRVKLNTIRESLFTGDYELDDAEMEEALKACEGMETEVPVELDPNRKDKPSKEAVGDENLDPATETTFSEDAEGVDTDEEEESGKGDEEAETEKAGKDEADEDSDADVDGDSDSDSDSETEEASDEASGDSGDGTGEDESDTEMDGDSEGASDPASVSAETEGDEKGGGTSSDAPDGDPDEAEDEAEGGSAIDEEDDSIEPAEASDDSDVSEPKNDKTEKPSKEEESDEVTDAQLEARAKAAKTLEKSETTDKQEGDAETESTYADEIERIRENAADWSDTETEQQMMEDEDGEESEFDQHVISIETMMGIELKKAFAQDETDNEHYTGMHDGKTVDDKMVSLPFTREFDEVIEYTGKGDREEYTKRKRIVMPVVTPVRLHLERVLKIKENVKTRYDRERGALNARRLFSVVADKNYRKPFKATTSVDTKDVAIQMLIDCSGSMSGGDKMEVARQTALALGESLKAIQIPFEVTGFNTAGSTALSQAVRDAGLDSTELSRFNRLSTILRLMVFKSFDSQDLSGICLAESGGANADGESLVWAAKRLAERKEKRKILVVLSDGQPSDSGDDRILAGDLKRVVKMLPLAGIEVIGIGIQTDAPKQFYPKWVEVNTVKMLPSVVMKEISKMLIEGLQ